MLLTPTQIELATAMRANGMSWDDIAVKLRTTLFKLRSVLDPHYREKRRECSAKAQKRMQERRAAIAKAKGETLRAYKPLLEHNPHAMFKAEMAPKIVPSQVLAERDRAYGDWLTVNQAILGDPPPGRSALDKRRPHVVASND